MRRLVATWVGLMLRAVIRAYQLLVAPVLPASCRYLPSCSHYAEEAIDRHGPLHGSLLAVRRLCRCQPWGGSGYDPVPDVKVAHATAVPAAHATNPPIAGPRRRRAARR